MLKEALLELDLDRNYFCFLSLIYLLDQFDFRKLWTERSFWAKFMKIGLLIDFFIPDWMRYGYKTRNEQKGSKMAAEIQDGRQT